MDTNSRVIVVAFTMLLAFASGAPAAVLFDNFGPGESFPDSGRIVEGPLVVDIADIDQAASFMTGSHPAFITDVKLGMYVDSPASSPFDGTGPLDISIAEDAGGLPGSILTTTSLNITTYLSQVVDAPIGGAVELQPNTQYWVIANGQGKFDGAWEFNPVNDFGPVAGRSSNGPWSLQNPNDPRLVFSVQARVVPEPATLGMLAVGLASLGLAGWRRKRLSVG